MATDTTLCDLPLEIVTMIAGMCRGHDVEAFGATCQSMRAVARDPLLWRRLFERDFGDLYSACARETQWIRHVRNSGPWIDAICAAWDTVRPPLTTPSREWAWVPEPFARIEFASKDARWLYKAHAMAVAKHGGLPGASSPVFVGDMVADKRHGYGVLVHGFDRGRAQHWTEGMWADDKRASWSVDVDLRTDSAVLTAMRGDFCQKYSPTDLSGVTYSSALVDGMRQGLLFYLRNAESLRPRDWVSCAAYRVDDAIIRDRALYADGSTSEYVYDEDGKRHGRATTWYGNGDRVDHELTHGKPTRVFEFAFSPTCVDTEFAGRTVIHEEWGWAMVDITLKGTEWTFWPMGDSEGARLFWRYVERGLIGWHPRLREEALLHRNANTI